MANIDPAIINALNEAYAWISQPKSAGRTEFVYDARDFNRVTSILRRGIAVAKEGKSQ